MVLPLVCEIAALDGASLLVSMVDSTSDVLEDAGGLVVLAGEFEDSSSSSSSSSAARLSVWVRLLLGRA